MEVFSWTLPAVFIISPLIGWSVDKAGIVNSLVAMHCCALLFSILKMVPILKLQFFTFAVFSIYRGLFFTVIMALLLKMYLHLSHHLMQVAN